MIIVDALDEASSATAPRLLDKLKKLPKDKVSIMITSQRTEDEPPRSIQIQCDGCDTSPLKIYFRCRSCMDEGVRYYLCQSCRDDQRYCKHQDQALAEPSEILMDIEPSEEEIRLYVQDDLEDELSIGASDGDEYQPVTFGTTPLGRLCQKQPSIRKEILDSVVSHANGMFALAALYMNSFKNLGLSEAEILAMLDHPPEGYSGFYEQYMKRISAGSVSEGGSHASILGMKVLLWVAFTKRSLSLSELLDALAVDLDKPGFNTAARHDKPTIVGVTRGLVTVFDDENKTVMFTHGNVQKYLDQNRERWFPNASSEITRVALHYLSISELAGPCEEEWEDKDFEMRKRDFPFLEYAYQHWGDHAKDGSLDQDAQDAVNRFVSDPNKIAASIQASWYLNCESSVEWDVRKGANGLHMCAWFGLTFALPSVLDQGIDIDSKDPHLRQTPLMYACRRGNLTTVAALLDRGACLDAISLRGKSALFEAVCANELEVLDMLLDRPDLNINATNTQQSNQSCLMLAAQDGHIDIVRALSKHPRVAIDQQDNNQNTALSHAINSEHPEVALCILDHASPEFLDLQDWKGSTALMLAATKGQVEVVDRLLTEGAKPFLTDRQDGGTAILRAVEEGHLGVLETMIRHRVDIHSLDERGYTLLHSAASNERDSIVRFLIKKGLDKNARNKKNSTPLHEACRNSCDEYDVTYTLLAAGADVTLEDNAGRTPRTVAWQNSNIAVIKILEGKSPDDITEEDLLGEYPNVEALPVWSLAQMGYGELVSQAVTSRHNDIFALDPDTGDSALHCAVDAGQAEIVHMLLNAGVPLTATNDYGRTPLHIAALAGGPYIMKVLLDAHTTGQYDKADCDIIEMKDRWGTSALLMSAEYRHLDCALLLIEAGASIPSSRQSLKQSLFFSAIEFGNLTAMINLVNMGADVQAKDVLGQTALQMAKDERWAHIESFLRKHKDMKVGDKVEVTVEDEAMASLRLTESPFHAPKIGSHEKVEEDGRIGNDEQIQDLREPSDMEDLRLINGLHAPTTEPVGASKDSSGEDEIKELRILVLSPEFETEQSP